VRTILFASSLPHPLTISTTWRQRALHLISSLHQAICFLHGHDWLTHFDSRRIYLECAACGRQTPGWNVAVGQSKTLRRLR
jgi:hypothetical protein